MESRKSFAGIHDDYAFFLEHTDQQQRLSEAVAARLADVAEGARVLDYGCGRGGFLEAVLGRLGWGRAELTLVEPDPKFLAEAARRLSRFQVTTAAEIPAARQDVVLAAEVLYYVQDLRASLESLAAPGGRVLVVLGGHGKVTTQLRQSAYRMLGLPFPFYLAEDVEQLLRAGDWQWTGQQVPSTLAFPDRVENRLSLLRFLLGNLLNQLEESAALALFDPFIREGRVVMEHYDWLFDFSRTGLKT
ncbi:hypothetical protein ABS71_22895 [bacterium SCN 62-11]|nr:MAG: hypothetical protein ABS71_22895 [bacterium SCN 62-11]